MTTTDATDPQPCCGPPWAAAPGTLGRRSALLFARHWARYELARPGTFQLNCCPAEEWLGSLDRGHAQMRAMFITEPPEFEVVMARLPEPSAL